MQTTRTSDILGILVWEKSVMQNGAQMFSFEVLCTLELVA